MASADLSSTTATFSRDQPQMPVSLLETTDKQNPEKPDRKHYQKLLERTGFAALPGVIEAFERETKETDLPTEGEALLVLQRVCECIVPACYALKLVNRILETNERTSDDEELLIGNIIRIEHLGGGNFGDVYLALQGGKDGQLCALKIMK